MSGRDFRHFDEMPEVERLARYDAAARAFVRVLSQSHSNGDGYSPTRRPTVAFVPIDHSGGNAWGRSRDHFYREIADVGDDGAYIMDPKCNLSQEQRVWEGEYRITRGSPRKIFPGSKLDDVTDLVIVENSVSRTPSEAGVIGPSTMGGVVWAIQNLRYFGDDDSRVKVYVFIERDYGPQRIANVSCHYRNPDWLGSRRQLYERMPRTLKMLNEAGFGPEIFAISDAGVAADDIPQTWHGTKADEILASTGLSPLAQIWKDTQGGR